METVVNKFINKPSDAVHDCIRGAAVVNPLIGIIQNTQVVALKTL